MKEKVLEIINMIRKNKGLDELKELKDNMNLREDIKFTSFDLAELTVRIEDVFDKDIFEDGLISTVGEIYKKLS